MWGSCSAFCSLLLWHCCFSGPCSVPAHYSSGIPVQEWNSSKFSRGLRAVNSEGLTILVYEISGVLGGLLWYKSPLDRYMKQLEAVNELSGGY